MNCIIIEDNHLSRKLIEIYIQKVDNLTLIYSFSDVVEALNKIKSTSDNIDLIFLDIEMPTINGFEFLNLLNKYPQIILITAFDKYVIKSYEYFITSYLLKPIIFDCFFKAVDKAFIKFSKSIKTKPNELYSALYIKSNNAVIKLIYNDIIFIKGFDNYVKIYTKDECHIILATIKGLVEKLDVNNFIRVHYSYIVNINEINKIENSKIFVATNKGQVGIPISLSYKKRTINKLKKINYPLVSRRLSKIK